jgi:hypothetical protein
LNNGGSEDIGSCPEWGKKNNKPFARLTRRNQDIKKYGTGLHWRMGKVWIQVYENTIYFSISD